MTAELTFYTNPMSRGRIAHWMLEEVGRPYRTVFLDFGPPMQTPEYRRLNPMGKVPTLVHGDTVVTECAAVCAYLADAFPEAGLAPEPARRGAYYRWLFFAAGPLEAAVTNRMLGVEVPEERRGMVGYGSFPRVLDALETAAAAAVERGGYIAGDCFSAADVYVGAQIGFGLRFNSIEARPAFTAYWERIADRPAAVRARELDDAAMPAKAPAGEEAR
jgi:glutathione S-transferase